MEKTGVFFEMTETFTLENMFAMELDKHTDVLNEIVTAAVKEVAIEKVGLRSGAVGSRGAARPPGERASAAAEWQRMVCSRKRPCASAGAPRSSCPSSSHGLRVEAVDAHGGTCPKTPSHSRSGRLSSPR